MSHVVARLAVLAGVHFSAASPRNLSHPGADVCREVAHVSNVDRTSEQFDDAAWAAWVCDTCLLFGTTVETAYRVAAMFIEGLKHEGETNATV
jgi:hypothetical protein